MASFPDDPDDYRYHRILFYDGNRSPKRKTIYLKKSSHYGKEGYTKTEAQEWKKRRELAFKDGEYDPWREDEAIHKEQVTTLEEAKDQYLDRARRELAESTIATRQTYLSMLTNKIGAHKPISRVKDWELEEFVNGSGIAYKTKMKRLETVNALFDYASRQGWAEHPEIDVLAKRAAKKRAKRNTKTWIRPEEYQTVKDGARKVINKKMQNNYTASNRFSYLHDFFEEFDNVFDFLINTALRRSDFLNLSTDWFIRDFTMMRIGDEVYQPKSKEAEEIIPLTPEAQQIGRHWTERFGQSTRPFKDIKKRYITGFFNDVFEVALAEKSDKLSLHKMRDSAAMYLLFEKGYKPQTVQQITRHEDLSTLNIYLHWAPEEGLKEIENKG